MNDTQNNQQQTNSSPSIDGQVIACEQCKHNSCICPQSDAVAKNIEAEAVALSQASPQDDVKPPKMSWI